MRPRHALLTFGLLAGLLAWGAGSAAPAAAAPSLWGYGVKPCTDFTAAMPADPRLAELADPATVRYREWLSGLVTGLNLATGRDVLAGAELDAALQRIRGLCEQHPLDDFFTAALRLIRSLGQLQRP